MDPRITIRGIRTREGVVVTINRGREVVSELPPRTDLVACSDGSLDWYTPEGRDQLAVAILAYCFQCPPVIRRNLEAFRARFCPQANNAFSYRADMLNRWLMTRVRAHRKRVCELRRVRQATGEVVDGC